MENINSEHYFQCCCSPWYHPIASFDMFFSFIDSFFFASFFCPLCSDRISSGNMITFTMGPLTYNNTQSLELPEIVSQNNVAKYFSQRQERGVSLGAVSQDIPWHSVICSAAN